MASIKRPAIDQAFGFLVPPLPDAIKDISHNNHFKPILANGDNWTVFVEKDENELFVLRFAYQMRTKNEEIDKWVKMKLWTVECAVAQGEYVVLDLEKQEDRVTLILQESYHPFSKNDCENNSPYAACFNLAAEFQDYACNAHWTGKRLGRLLNNVTRVNGDLLEAKNGKAKKKVVVS